MEAVFVVADAAEVRGLTAELGEGDSAVGDRATRDKSRIGLGEQRENFLLFREVDESHGAAFEAETLEFELRYFDEQIDDGVAHPAQVEAFHDGGRPVVKK